MDYAIYYLDNEYIEVPRPTIVEQIKEKQEHNQMMIEVAANLSYAQFDDVKECTTAKKMWDKLAQIYGGDENVMRANVEILREICDDMRIK